MTDRSHLPAGVPHLLDQYKQRRQAWLDQADELARLRDEVRLAAEREALDIVTAARRDVRRIVVEARRELLVLTAQLHAAVESVDQTALPPGDASDLANFAARLDTLGSVESLGATRDAVLGARREVRSVLDEARAEIEALAAEARAPLPEAPEALLHAVASEPPIPTLETILGSEPPAPPADAAAPSPSAVAPAHDFHTVIDLPSERYQADRGDHAGVNRSVVDPPFSHQPVIHQPVVEQPVIHQPVIEPPVIHRPVIHQPVVEHPVVNVPPAVVDLPIFVDPPPAPAPQPAPLQLAVMPAPQSVLTPRLLAHERESTIPGFEASRSFVLAADADSMLGGFHKRESEERTGSPLSTFAETGPIRTPEPQVAFLDDYEGGSRSRPMWAWVGMFAATGVLLLAGAAWWAQAREARNTVLASITATNPTQPPGGGDKAGAAGNEAGNANTAAPTSAAPVTPAGLSIEVRRTAWLRAIVDGKEDSRVYQAGETRNIVSARAVSLRAGDGGAVFVSVDGRQAEALGVSGTAVTRQYSLAPAVVPAVASSTPSIPTAAANTATPGTRPPAAVPPPAGPTAGRLPGTPTRLVDAPPPPAPQPAAPAAAAEATGGGAPTGGRADLVSAGTQWLDAYQRRDQSGMASSGTDNVTISDERTLTERFPAWQTGIRRDLDQVELELTGDTALLTARMTERNGDNSSTSAQHVSRISQIWVRRNGRWRVADVRIMGEGRLNQIVR